MTAFPTPQLTPLRRRPVSAALLALALAAPSARALQDPATGEDAQEPPHPFVALDFEAGAARAAEQGRVLVVELSAPGSGGRAELESAWADDAVARWLEVETVAVRLDPTDEPALVARYGIDVDPTVLLLDVECFELGRLEGGFRPKRFVKTLKAALELRTVLADLRPRLLESPEQADLHLALARAYDSVGLVEPAVEAYDAAWRLGREVYPFERIRTGAVANELGRLTANHAPARKVLIRWRLEALEALEDPTTPEAVVAARELSAIHRVQQDALGAAALYEQYRARPETPRPVLEALFDRQVTGLYHSQERYQELAEGLGDVFRRLEEEFAQLDVWRAKEREGTVPPGEEPMVGVLSNSLYAHASMYLETLLQLEREDEARQLVDLVLLREPYAQAYVALMRAARQGGSAQLAREIADRGLEALQRKERVELEQQVERFFKDRGR